jgi:mono/diheme cytochrome c family protein
MKQVPAVASEWLVIHVRKRQHARAAIQVLVSVPLLVTAFALAIGPRSQQVSDQRVRHSSGSSNAISKARPLPNRKFEATPERLARGEYLVKGIGECFACHSPSDVNRLGWPPLPGKEGSGFDYTTWGYPGQVAPNITPDRETGTESWTDDMLGRAIREGVGHDGRLLDPAAMPYEFYRSMSDEDLASIVVYLRSVPPLTNALPESRTANNIVAPYAIPITAPIPAPDLSTPIRRGAYLAQIGACQWCHTLRNSDRQSLPGLAFAGGDLITNSHCQASSANLTPDPSGISYYDEAQFLKTMRTGKVGARKISPIMPWWYFSHMTDDDLKAIFAYLRTVAPVRHRVDNSEPVAYCRICGRRHGGGALN